MTKTMILGLLKSFGPLSGYKIKTMLDLSQTALWANVQPASIYHALRKLEAEGSVTLDTLEQTGLRTSALYKITDKGNEELKLLLEQAFATSSVLFPSVLYTALTFIHELPSATIREALVKQEQEMITLIGEMQAGEQAKQEYGAMTKQAAAVFRNMYAQCELQLQFIRELLADLPYDLPAGEGGTTNEA